MAIWSKPDFASVWPVQCAWMSSSHTENDRYWRVVGMQGLGIHYYKLLETCHNTQIDSFVTSWGCAQLKVAIQNHWLVDYSTVREWRRLYSLCHRIRAIVQSEYSHMPYQRNYCYIVSLVIYPRINPFVDIPIWPYLQSCNKYATFCLFFALPSWYIIFLNITYAKWFKKITKQHFALLIF